MAKKRKALALLSGGLDSSLAAWLIKKQSINVKGIIFQSCFFGPDKGIKAGKQLKIPYQVIDFSKDHLKMIKKPKHGYGKAINPCIDCHILMLKKTKQILDKENYDFVVTGEVLGQRPFSQNKRALAIIAQESGLKDRLLRPLSARLLPLTLPEQKGWVKKEILLDIKGRGRKRQMELANKINLKYPQPAGGCILTELEFAKKLKSLLEKKPDFNANDIELIKIGRHFWQGKIRIILGKNQEENNQIEKLALPKDILVQPANFAGPTALIRANKIAEKNIQEAKKLILNYSKKQIKTKPIVFFGSSQESVEVLRFLLKEKVNINWVITQPDRPAGRGKRLTPTAISQFCQKSKIPVLKWEKLNKESLKKTASKLKTKPILGIVAVYGNFIPQSWLDWLGMVINLHPSLLPKWRGAAPVIRTIEAGNKKTGITIFKIVKEMDAGPIINQIKTRVKENETAGKLIQRLFITGTKKVISILKSGVLSKKPSFWVMNPQDDTKATLANKIDKSEAEIDRSKPVKTILNQINAFNPFPGAYTFVKVKNKQFRLKIWKAHIENKKLVPDEVQLEGKTRVSWQQFKEGYPTIKLPLIKK